MYSYETFGRRVESAVRLPHLPAARADPLDATAHREIVVRRASLPETPAALDDAFDQMYEGDAGELFGFSDGRTVYWFAPGAGTVRVRAGGEIDADPLEGSVDDALGRVIVGPGVRTACRQQGAVVFHASAVAFDDCVVAFVGPGGRGKSTAAAACYADGRDVVADDAIVVDRIDGTPTVQPAPPALDVAPDAAAALGLGDGGRIDVSDRCRREPTPLAAVYVLEDGDDLDVVREPPRRGAFALLGAADRLATPTNLEAHRPLLEDVSAVASSASVARLIRPRSLSRLSALPAAVARDLQENAVSA